jgi:type IV fimbrial biogenesis protein FimT
MLPQRSHNKGFTLIEVMVTLTVAAILAAISVPSFKYIIRNTTLTSLTNQLVATMSTARSEAIKQGVPVSIDALSGNGDWSQGWQVVKRHADGSVCDAKEACLIRQFDAVKSGYSIKLSEASSNAIITYLPSGLLSSTGSVELKYAICAADHPVHKQVSVSETGRVASDTIDQACS